MGGGVSGAGSTDMNSMGDRVVRSPMISGVTSRGAASAAMPATAQPAMLKHPIGECAGAGS